MKKVFVAASMVLALGTALVSKISLASTDWRLTSAPTTPVSTATAQAACPDQDEARCAFKIVNNQIVASLHYEL